MTRKTKATALTEDQVDAAVIAQAENEDAWGEPVRVEPYHRALSLRMPIELLRRTALQARKEGFSHVEDWVMHLLTLAVSPEPNTPLIKEKPVQYGTVLRSSGGKILSTKKPGTSEAATIQRADAGISHHQKKKITKR